MLGHALTGGMLSIERASRETRAQIVTVCAPRPILAYGQFGTPRPT